MRFREKILTVHIYTIKRSYMQGICPEFDSAAPPRPGLENSCDRPCLHVKLGLVFRSSARMDMHAYIRTDVARSSCTKGISLRSSTNKLSVMDNGYYQYEYYTRQTLKVFTATVLLQYFQNA